jgi:plastocyanin
MSSGDNDLVIDLVTPGVYTFYCRFHRFQGMTGTITVTG